MIGGIVLSIILLIYSSITLIYAIQYPGIDVGQPELQCSILN